MNTHIWGMFTIAVLLLSGSPGPNMLHILSRSVELGLRRCIAAMVGCLMAVVLVLSASAAGLTTLLLAVPGAFDVLRLVGVAYLVYLGMRVWFSDSAPIDIGADTLDAALSPAKVFRGGLMIGLSNPKLIMFAAAFLPQFVDPGKAHAPQFAILVATFAGIETSWYFVYALGGQSLAQYLVRPSIKRAFNRITGGIFVGFGLALLRVKPA